MGLRYFRHGDGAEALKIGANMGVRPFRTVDDKPVLHSSQRGALGFSRQAFVAARGEPSISTRVREEKQAVISCLCMTPAPP